MSTQENHGGNIRHAEARYGFGKGAMLDLSTGISPYPYPHEAAVADTALWRELPQAESHAALAHAIRQNYQMDENAAICLAPGSRMLINLLPLLFKEKVTVAIPSPCYGDHAAAWKLHGHAIIPYPAGGIPAPDTADVVVAVRPGNPLGEMIPTEDILQTARHAALRGGPVVVDEAFCDLLPGASMLPHAGMAGMIVLRSFGKFFGLAGLRLGFAAGAAADMARLGNLLGEWAVSAPALAIGRAAYADSAWQAAQRERIEKAAGAMLAVLARHGLKRAGGTGLYHLMETEAAPVLHDHLARAGIWTRIFPESPRRIRIGLADSHGLARLDTALAAFNARQTRN